MIDFYQIYYDESQLPEIYDFAIPYKNDTISPYFENAVIADLVPKSNANLISVCSWALRKKRGMGWTPIALNGVELTKERLLENAYDIAILCPFAKEHETMESSSAWHGKAWDEGIKKLREIINIPEKIVGNAIYYNHFIAKKEIYHEYVNGCLIPVLRFMDENEVFSLPSGYINKKRDKVEIEKIKNAMNIHYQREVNDWPIAPFILERLFRIWINDKQFRIINL